MGQNQSTAVEEPYHKRHYIETNRQIQRQNSISLTSPTHLLAPPSGNNPLRDYALKRQATMGMQSGSTFNLHSGSLPATAITAMTGTNTGSGAVGGGSGVAGDNSGSITSATTGDEPKPFIRLLPIEIPQPVYFDESSASEEDYDYEGDDYSDGGYSDTPHSRHNSSSRHYSRRHPHQQDSDEDDSDDQDLVEHHHAFDRTHNHNNRGLAASPSPSSYLDNAHSVNSRQLGLSRSTMDAYDYEHHGHRLSREQADYRRSKEEEEEDLSYLSPVSGTRRFFKEDYPRGGLRSEPYYPPHYLDLDNDNNDHTHNQNLTDATDSDGDEAYSEELFLKRYQLRDLPRHTSVSSSQSDSIPQDNDALVHQLDIKTYHDASSPLPSSSVSNNNLDVIREEKEDGEESGMRPPSSSFSSSSKAPISAPGGKGGEGGPVSVSSSHSGTSLDKEKSRMGYSLDHAQPLQEANNQHNNNNFSSNDNNNSFSFSAHKSSSPLPPLNSSSSSSSYQQQEQGRSGQDHDQKDLDLDLNLDRRPHGEAVHQAEQGFAPIQNIIATATSTSRTAVSPPALAPRPPLSTQTNGDVIIVHDSLDSPEEENDRDGRRERRSQHPREGSTTLRKEMLSNVSQRVGDLDSRVNQMEALVSYKLTDIEAKVQVLHDGQPTTTSQDPSHDLTSQDTTTSSPDPLPVLSFAEGVQPDLITNSTTSNANRTSQLLDKASLLELRLELQTFGMRFHELNDALLTDLMTQMRQAKVMLLESTATSLLTADDTLGTTSLGLGPRRVDRAEVEMHARLLKDIETRIQDRVLAMEQTSERLERCFDKMEARLGALETVLVASAGTGGATGAAGTTMVMKRPRPESMYKILQQQQQLQLQQQQLQREQEEFKRLQAQHQQQGQGQIQRGFSTSQYHRGTDSSPESQTPNKHLPSNHTTTTSPLSNISCTNSDLLPSQTPSSSLNAQKPPTGPQYSRATRPTRILTTSLTNSNSNNTSSNIPHLLQQRTAPTGPLSAGPTATVTRPRHNRERALTLQQLHHNNNGYNGTSNNNHTHAINGHINGPVSAHPLSSSLPLARHHLLLSQRSMTSLMAGPLTSNGNSNGPKSATTTSTSTSENANGANGEGGRASKQKIIRRPSSYKELLHFWKAGGSTPDLLNTTGGDS
ncbi:hypothetical protein BGW39_008887 [Mortierella sp. 14UC]|nr:hypothetical protein BGW39_008887 [Mortierella sp. 14UC]